VLLTAGKLEPIKPEEAQRVRAEGYIVKPFEASELLSALSKLEDKVVPRAEPSKPGRFARAMAAADESDSGGRKERSNSETGWKNRISFPNKKAEAEEAVAEEALPTNRDGQKAADKDQKDKRHPSSAPAAETNVDISAFAPIGIPKDVTPSEVAAITAAAAQMQMAEAATHVEQKGSEPGPPQTAPGSEFAVEPALETFQDSRAEQVQIDSGAEVREAEAKAGSDEQGKKVSSELAAPGASQDRNGQERVGESQDVPMTMAAGSESAAVAGEASPRWTAVPVALGSDETSMSLDHEMQKAYAAFAAADYATSAGIVEHETESHDSFSAPTESRAESPAAEISTSEPVKISESELVPAESRIETSPAPDPAKPVENLESTAALVSPPAGAALGGDATKDTDGSGAATFTDLSIVGPVGSYTLRFTSGSLTAVTSSAISLTTGPVNVRGQISTATGGRAGASNGQIAKPASCRRASAGKPRTEPVPTLPAPPI